MSIDVNPDLYDYAVPPNVCPACFDAGKSPETVFACFAGIEIGTLWAPPLPGAPNTIYELPAVQPCRWLLNIGIWQIDLDLRLGVSSLQIWDGGAVWAFLKGTVIPCSSHFTSNIVNPAREYFNGYGVIVPPLPGDTFSASDLVELLGMDPSVETFLNPRPEPAELSVFTLSRGSDATNVKILYDHA